MKWLLSVMFNAINVSSRKVSKVPGVVNQVPNRGDVQFYAFKVYMTDFFLYAISVLSEMLIST